MVQPWSLKTFAITPLQILVPLRLSNACEAGERPVPILATQGEMLQDKVCLSPGVTAGDLLFSILS